MNKFSISQVLLAAAIGYLAFALLQIAKEIPTLVQVVDKTAATADKFQPQIDEIITNIEAINQQIPEALKQIELTRPLIEDVIVESQQYSNQIPALLEHLTTIESQVAAIEKQIPEILTRIDQVVLTTNNTTKEVALWRPHSTAYIAQIKHSREDIPQYLTRVEDIIVDAKSIGQEASSGMVTGLFQGVVSLPFNVVSKLAGIVDTDSRSAKYLTDDDVAMIQAKAIILLDDGGRNKINWRNKDSGNSGTITKGKRYKSNNKTCYKMTMKNNFNRESETLNEAMCRDKEGDWKIK